MPFANQVTNQVRSTTNYRQFGLIAANRDINKNHVNKIAESMEESGNFTEANPVLVNENMEVIDGQHRLAACEQLGLPVFYTVVRGQSIADARKMNILHRRWTALDFLDSYVEERLPAYIQLKELSGEYEVSMTVLILFSYGKYWDGYNAEFRRGELLPFNMDKARRLLDILMEFQAISEAFKLKSMALALLQAMRNPDYDHDRMVRKITSHASEVRAYQNVSDNLRQLENLYNIGRTQGRTRFF